ncbi:hypothetical protein [Rhizocola hellebori]|nr:hypothetical protein [Rhizocola hellebori]
MATVEQYVEAVRGALVGDGCEVSQELLAGDAVTVGYRGNAKAATRMHTFTVVAVREKVDEAAVLEFTSSVVDLAKVRKGTWRGAQSGVLAMPVLVSESVDAGAVALMAKAFRLNMGGFAAMAHPAIVDVAQGAVHTFRGTRWWGYAYNGLIRKKLALYLPDPGKVGVAR